MLERIEHARIADLGSQGAWSMAVPALTQEGYLPAGVHTCTLQEVQDAFGTNDHRNALLSKLCQFIDMMDAQHGLKAPIYVDGSFVTGKTNPSDIDVVLDLTECNKDEIGEAMIVFAQERCEIKQRLSIDFYPYFPNVGNDLRSFFQYIRLEEMQQKQLPPDSRKGILRIEP